MLFRVNVGVYNKHRRLRSGVHSVRRQTLSDAIKFDVSKNFIPFDGKNPHDVASYHGKTRATMWIFTTKGYGMMLPSRLHWAEGCGECAHASWMRIPSWPYARIQSLRIYQGICVYAALVPMAFRWRSDGHTPRQTKGGKTR